MKTRAPFMPVTDDIDDDKLERLAAEKGVGSLVKPVANRVGEERAKVAETSAAADVGEATPADDMTSINVDLPTYVWTALKIRAAERRTSLKHVVMTALRKDGVTIHDIDMIEDGRRLRGSAVS